MRSGALTPVAAAVALSIGAVLVTRAMWGSESALAWALRLVVVVLAGSVGFALDDPSEPMMASAPTTLLARRTFRLLPAATVVALGWAVSITASSIVPTVALTLMLAGLGLACAAVGALAARRAPGRAGVAGACFVLATVFVITRLPERWAMLPDPAGGLGGPAKLRWITISAVALGVLSCASRDPARAR